MGGKEIQNHSKELEIMAQASHFEHTETACLGGRPCAREATRDCGGAQNLSIIA